MEDLHGGWTLKLPLVWAVDWDQTAKEILEQDVEISGIAFRRIILLSY